MSAYCTTCGKPIEPNAQFCLHCGAPTAPGAPGAAEGPPRAVSARPRRQFKLRVSRRFWLALAMVLLIAAAGAAFWFRSYLGPPAAVVGQWSGAVAAIPPDAGPYASANSVDVSIDRVGQGGSLIGTISIGSASTPLSGRIRGHHVSIVADFSPASVDAPHPRFIADGTIDGETIETRATFKIGVEPSTGVLIDEPVILTRGIKKKTVQSTPAPAAVAQTIVSTPSPVMPDPQTAAPVPAPAAAPVSAPPAVDTVRTYYRLWNQGDFRTMYGMLSTRMQIKNPYVQYVKYHSLVTQITVDAYQEADPTTVAVRIVSRDRERDGRITENVNAGRWFLIWVGDQWRLDKQDVHDVK